MRMRSAWSLIVLFFFCASPAAAGEEPARRISIAVMEFSSKTETLSKEKMEALSDVLANALRDAGNHKVVGKDDIRAALSFEQQKTLMGCDDEGCIAELGGALGVDFIVIGNLSRFGESFLINLKLINVFKVEVAKGVSRTIPAKEETLVAELPSVARELAQALKGQPTNFSAQVQADLQNYVSERAGSWPVSVNLGLVGMVPPYASNEGFSKPETQNLKGLDEGLLGGRVSLFAGYALLDWLVIGPKLSYATAGDTRGRRLRQWLDGSLEIQGSLPLNYWLRPMVSVAAGVGKMWDKAKDDDRDDLDSLMVNLEMAVGLDFMLDEHWALGAHFAAFLCTYPSVHDESGTRLDSLVLALGLTAALNVSYEF